MSTTGAKVIALDSAATPDETARKWVLRIDAGPLSAPEREALRQWLASDPSHASLLDTHALLWSAAAKARFKAPPEGAPVARPASRLPVKRAVAGLALAAAVLGVVLWPGLTRHTAEPVPAAQFATAVGEHKLVPLQDGSQMHLNTGTATQVLFSAERRRVVLERGEGLFEVAKDKTRPFEVVVGGTIVRAVGTRFTVRRLDNGRVDVTVFEGVVELIKSAAGTTPEADAAAAATATTAAAGGRQPLRLGVGQVARELDDSIVLSTNAPPVLERKLSWLQGRLVFDNEPLAEVIAQVNRYSPRPVRLADTGLQGVRVSGAYATADVEVFLRSLELGFGLSVERRGDSYIVSRKS